MEEMLDELVTYVDIRFCWVDRFKLLVNGKAHVRVNVKCENVVGRTRSHSTTWTPPLFHRKSDGGYMALRSDVDPRNLRKADLS